MAHKKNDRKLGWHFLPSDMTLTNGDGRKVTVGATLKMKGTGAPACCANGMHASDEIADAAAFERGPVLSRVEVWGDIDEDGDKFCGRYRRATWMKEVTENDLRAIARSMNMPHAIPSGSVFVKSSLKFLAYRNPGAFNCAVEAWARKNGASDATTPTPPEKPLMQEKDLIKLLTPRVVRTRREIMRDVGSYYDMTPEDNCTYSDRFDEIVEGSSRILVVEDIDGRGNDGFVLRGRNR